MNPLGIMMSFLTPFIFVDPKHEEMSVIRSQVKDFFTFHSALAGFMFFTTLFFFHENKANKEMKEEEEGVKISIGSQLKTLFSDSTYICLLLSFAIVNASLGGISAVLSPIVAVWGHDEVKKFNKLFSLLEQLVLQLE